MPELKELCELIKKCLEKHPDAISEGHLHDLRGDKDNEYPYAKDEGIYAVLHEQDGTLYVLYIGESESEIGKRLGSYFDKHGNPDPKHTWTKPPTHVKTWKVDDSLIDIKELEKCLIDTLNPPDNTHHRTDQ